MYMYVRMYVCMYNYISISLSLYIYIYRYTYNPHSWLENPPEIKKKQPEQQKPASSDLDVPSELSHSDLDAPTIWRA